MNCMYLHFCTSLALNSVPKLAALLNSLESHVKDGYTMWVLCEELETLRAVEKLSFKTVKTILFDDFENSDRDVLAIKSERDAFEYNCTLRPAWMLYLLKSASDIEWLTYVDTDLFFFDDPSPIYEEAVDSSVLITLHRLSKLAVISGTDVNVVGKYNAGWVAVKNDDDARKVLSWWRERCLEWCYRIPSDGKFGEQKYLDGFESVSDRVSVVKHIGANVAPWNMNDLKVWVSHDGKVMIENDSLIFFHFHALKVFGESSFKVDDEFGKNIFQLTSPGYIISNEIFKYVYDPYLETLIKYLSPETNLNTNVIPKWKIYSNLFSFKSLKRAILVARTRVIFTLILLFKFITNKRVFKKKYS